MKFSSGSFSIELLPLRTADDEDWARVTVLVSASGFNGEFEAWLQLSDLQRFRVEVCEMYGAIGHPTKAALICAEPGVKIMLEMQTLGGIVGTYEFESERLDGRPTALSGAFNCDQSYLPDLMRSVDALIQELQTCLPIG